MVLLLILITPISVVDSAYLEFLLSCHEFHSHSIDRHRIVLMNLYDRFQKGLAQTPVIIALEREE